MQPDSPEGARVKTEAKRPVEGEQRTGVPMPGQWLPIATAPKDKTRILVYPAASGPRGCRGQEVALVYWYQPGNPECPGFWVGTNDGKRARPTHWMPLPEPPTSLVAAAGEGA